MYEEIKNNIIERFLNTHYLWTCCTHKETIVVDMSKRIPFNVRYPNFPDYNTLEIDLGNDIKIEIKLKWEERSYKNTSGRDMVNYRLISIY